MIGEWPYSYDSFYYHLNGEIKEAIKSYQDSIINGIKIMKLIQDKSKYKDNIVRFYEYFINEKEIAIVMELCDIDLFSFICDREGLKPEGILEILNQLNNTFKIFYENKIIYKNLDIMNIFLSYNKNKEKIKFKISLVGYLKSVQSINTDELIKNRLSLVIIVPPKC